MAFFSKPKPLPAAVPPAVNERPSGKFGQAFDTRQGLTQRSQPQQSANPAVTPRSPLDPLYSATVSDLNDLPDYNHFADVGEKAAGYAALLVAEDQSAVLAIREDVWAQPSASLLRRVVSQEKKFTRLTSIRVTATVLGQLKALSNRKTEASGETGSANRPELHIARAFEMIAKGIELDASDIHLEVRTSGRDAPRVVQRMRMHGRLRTMSTEKSMDACEAWIEVIRGLYQNESICARATRTSTTWSSREKQEAMLKPPVKDAEVRFESLPEKGGFDVVMRINGYEGKSAARRSLAELGLSEEQSQDLTRASLAPHGLIVVVGATGSGKTTTVTTTLALDEQAEEKKRLSLEQPPESDIPWLSQLVVTPKTLTDIMDGVMRADPDVISGGEVRNHESGQMAQDFSITGHLTWVTVHANSVFLAIRRLVSPRLGFDIDILTMRNFLRAVLYQALVEKLCPSCSLPAAELLSKDKQALLTEKFGLDIATLWVRHQHLSTSGDLKCKRCDGVGTVGRTTVVELVVPTMPVLNLLRDGKVVEAEAEWRSSRTARFDEPGTQGKTYVEHALYKATRREICAETLFDLENLWNYEVAPMRSASSPDRQGARVVMLPHGSQNRNGSPTL